MEELVLRNKSELAVGNIAKTYHVGNVKGTKGDKGETGPIGASPNLTIGTVITGSSGTQANATITGTTPNLELNLTIPKGDDGITPNNITGNAGTATKLETARKINGVDFDGTKDIDFTNIVPIIPLSSPNAFYGATDWNTAPKGIFIINQMTGANAPHPNGYAYGIFRNTVIPTGDTLSILQEYEPFPSPAYPNPASSKRVCFDSQWSSWYSYPSAKALSSNEVGTGASLIGISDTANNFTSTNVEGALSELASRLKALENK